MSTSPGISSIPAALMTFPDQGEALAEAAPHGRVVDTNASFFGWSGISRQAFCALLDAYSTYGIPRGDDAPRPGLGPENLNGRDWGTLGHGGLAAQFARWGLAKGPTRIGDEVLTDVDEVLPRKPSIRRLVSNRQWQASVADNVIDFVEAYFDKTLVAPVGTVKGVEILYTSFLGRVNGELDLWVCREPAGGWPKTRDGFLDYDGELLTLDGRVVVPEKCRLPARTAGDGKRGYYEDRNIVMTRRFDLLYSERPGMLSLWDHKCGVFAWKAGKSDDGYRMDGQFCAARKFLKQLAGPEFGMRPSEVRLNYVNRVKPYINGGCVLPEVRLDGRFTRYYTHLWMKRALAERDVPWQEWEPRGLENQCKHTYGRCDAYSFCLQVDRG